MARIIELSHRFRRPQYPVLVDLDGRLVAAKSAKTLLKKLSEIDLPIETSLLRKCPPFTDAATVHRWTHQATGHVRRKLSTNTIISCRPLLLDMQCEFTDAIYH